MFNYRVARTKSGVGIVLDENGKQQFKDCGVDTTLLTNLETRSAYEVLKNIADKTESDLV